MHVQNGMMHCSTMYVDNGSETQRLSYDCMNRRNGDNDSNEFLYLMACSVCFLYVLPDEYMISTQEDEPGSES